MPIQNKITAGLILAIILWLLCYITAFGMQEFETMRGASLTIFAFCRYTIFVIPLSILILAIIGISSTVRFTFSGSGYEGPKMNHGLDKEGNLVGEKDYTPYD